MRDCSGSEVSHSSGTRSSGTAAKASSNTPTFPRPGGGGPGSEKNVYVWKLSYKSQRHQRSASSRARKKFGPLRRTSRTFGNEPARASSAGQRSPPASTRAVSLGSCTKAKCEMQHGAAMASADRANNSLMPALR